MQPVAVMHMQMDTQNRLEATIDHMEDIGITMEIRVPATHV